MEAVSPCSILCPGCTGIFGAPRIFLNRWGHRKKTVKSRVICNLRWTSHWQRQANKIINYIVFTFTGHGPVGRVWILNFTRTVAGLYYDSLHERSSPFELPETTDRVDELSPPWTYGLCRRSSLCAFKQHSTFCCWKTSFNNRTCLTPWSS